MYKGDLMLRDEPKVLVIQERVQNVGTAAVHGKSHWMNLKFFEKIIECGYRAGAR